MGLQDYSPMLATGVRELPIGPDWSYSVDFSGYRMLAESADGGVAIQSSSGIDYTRHYPDIEQELPHCLNGQNAVVDGKIVGFNLDERGLVDSRVLLTKRPKVAYFISDILELNGEVLLERPYAQRREKLETFAAQDHVRLTEEFNDGDIVISTARALKLQSVIARRRSAPYSPGKSNKDMLRLMITRGTAGFGH